MKSRITLTIDPVVARRAKQLAHARRTSVSGLIEDFLRSTPLPGEPKRKSFVATWAGRFELKKASAPDPRRERLIKKYGLNSR